VKLALIITTTCAIFFLSAGSSRATNVNFSDGDNNGGNYSNDYQSDNSKNSGGDNGGGNNGNNNSYSGNGNNDGDGGDNKNGGDKYKSGGYSLPASYSWSSYGGNSHDGNDGGKDKDGKGYMSSPECAPADPGHGKDDNGYGDKGGDDGKFGRHYVNYYKDLCDKGKHDHDPGHHRDCDPGSAAPLPGSLFLFATGLAILGLRKKIFVRAAK
jgi:hypothetical protein